LESRRERRDGVRGRVSTQCEPAALAAELRRLVQDGIAVTDFHREERKLEEAFVEMLRDPSARRRSVATEPPALPHRFLPIAAPAHLAQPMLFPMTMSH
jgi:hypothetical protein